MATSSVTGALAAQAQSSLLQSREANALRQVQSAQATNDDGKIEKGAKEFEALLLGSWLQQAEQSMAAVPGAEDDEDAGGREQMMSLGVQSLATSLSDSGGIGIAAMIAKALHSAADKVQQAAAAEPAAGAQKTEESR
jgi:Rod binding domain-containing protein